MKLIGVLLVTMLLVTPAAQAMTIPPPGLSTPATPKDYREVLRMLRGIEESLEELGGRTKQVEKDDCRGLSPEKTVECAARTFDTSVDQAVSVWRCESNWGVEQGSTMGHSYHGPYQFLYSTYESQQNSMPDIVEWFELSPAVHDMRSNILTAVAYASRHGWGGTWSCG